MSDRRELLTSLGACALAFAAPPGAFAQSQGKVWRIGFLSPISASHNLLQIGALLKGMRDLGYVEGGNMIIEWRFADGNLERLPGLAAELVRLKVDVIVADASPAIRAAQKATTTIPIVMASTGDPVGSGFVKSLARPGGNITGLALMTSDVSAKLLDLLRTVAPQLSRVAVLVSPSSSTYRAILDNVQAAARTAGIEVLPVEAQTPLDIDSGFARMVQSKVEALVIGVTPFFVQQRHQIVQLAVKHRLPSIAGNRSYAEAGGLMSYGQDIADSFSPRCDVCGQDPEGSQSRRVAGRATGEARVRPEPRDRQNTRPCHPAIAAAARRRGHSVTTCAGVLCFPGGS